MSTPAVTTLMRHAATSDTLEPGLAERLWDWAVRNDDPGLAARLADNPATPIELWRQLVRHDDEDVRACAYGRAVTDPVELAELADIVADAHIDRVALIWAAQRLADVVPVADITARFAVLAEEATHLDVLVAIVSLGDAPRAVRLRAAQRLDADDVTGMVFQNLAALELQLAADAQLRAAFIEHVDDPELLRVAGAVIQPGDTTSERADELFTTIVEELDSSALDHEELCELATNFLVCVSDPLEAAATLTTVYCDANSTLSVSDIDVLAVIRSHAETAAAIRGADGPDEHLAAAKGLTGDELDTAGLWAMVVRHPDPHPDAIRLAIDTVGWSPVWALGRCLHPTVAAVAYEFERDSYWITASSDPGRTRALINARRNAPAPRGIDVGRLRLRALTTGNPHAAADAANLLLDGADEHQAHRLLAEIGGDGDLTVSELLAVLDAAYDAAPT